jgi:hypothetical protein
MSKLASLTTRHGTLYRHDDTVIVMEDDDLWVTVTILDGSSSVLIDREEWPAFVEMVEEIDRARKDK